MTDNRIESHRKYRTELKDKVIKVLGGSCVCCGLTSRHNLTVDHIEPIMGAKRLENWKLYILIRDNPVDALMEFQLLCFGCNASKNKYEKCSLNHEDDLN